MKLKRFVVSSFQTNCYIYYDEHHAFIIDPGDNARKIKKFIEENELEVVAILLTHGHIDHIGALEPLVQAYGCKVYIHKEDKVYLTHPSYNLSGMMGQIVAIHVAVECYPEALNIDGHDIVIHHTPGHTPGSVMIEFVNEGVLFSGDTLFAGSIGRDDFPLSSHHDMMESLNYIKTIDHDMKVFPGHGDYTTLSHELETNPFLI